MQKVVGDVEGDVETDIFSLCQARPTQTPPISSLVSPLVLHSTHCIFVMYTHTLVLIDTLSHVYFCQIQVSIIPHHP